MFDYNDAYEVGFAAGYERGKSESGEQCERAAAAAERERVLAEFEAVTADATWTDTLHVRVARVIKRLRAERGCIMPSKPTREEIVQAALSPPSAEWTWPEGAHVAAVAAYDRDAGPLPKTALFNTTLHIMEALTPFVQRLDLRERDKTILQNIEAYEHLTLTVMNVLGFESQEELEGWLQRSSSCLVRDEARQFRRFKTLLKKGVVRVVSEMGLGVGEDRLDTFLDAWAEQLEGDE